jgi:hypothetical protein
MELAAIAPVPEAQASKVAAHVPAQASWAQMSALSVPVLPVEVRIPAVATDLAAVATWQPDDDARNYSALFDPGADSQTAPRHHRPDRPHSPQTPY